MSNLVDMRSALDELGIDQEDYYELVEDMQEFIEETMPRLKQAIESQNAAEIDSVAHSIKGALANLRFVEAARIAHQLEKKGKEKEVSDLGGNLKNLEEVLQTSFQEIKPG